MRTARYATSRQKACLPCSTAKAKCDRKAGCCSRCALRGLSCTYPQAVPSERSSYGASDDGGTGVTSSLSTLSARRCSNPSPGRELPAGTDIGSGFVESTQPMQDRSSGYTSTTFTGGSFPVDSTLDVGSLVDGDSEMLDLSQELSCPINAEDIRNRWLNSYIPVPGQKIKAYPASITAFIYRILNSYAAVTVRGRGVPPFVHASQVTATSARPQLSTCLTLVRMCEKPLPGSENVAAGVLQREMNNLYEKHGTYDDMALLVAFQAYLIYSMVLFFRLGQDSKTFLRQAIMNLQDLACSSSRRGLVCIAEEQRARPRWEAWIVAETKRRTLFAMYLFDSVLSAQDGLPTFLGTELQGLPAPANQVMWRAPTRREWEAAYNRHLADWVDGGLHIDELWPMPAHLDEPSILERRSRVDQWLENVDEFGTMLYAVTSCTHGG